MTLPARSQHRITMMASLIAELARRDITVQQAADFLHMTHAGGKNYMRDLRIAGLIAIVSETTGTVGQPAPIYRLTTDHAAIDQYLADLRAYRLPKRQTRPDGTLLAQALKDPTRHVHLLRDDAAGFKPVMHRITPVRDSLVAALFGAPRAHA
jgi:hypothetical protein